MFNCNVKVGLIYLFFCRLFFLIFCLQGVNRCVIFKDGKLDDFNKYGVLLNCKMDDQGYGVGEEGVNFVYIR